MKILIVNDSPVLTAVIKAIVNNEPNYNCVGSATNGIEAIQQTIQHLPDLVLMDIHMPQMNGVEAARQIIRARPKTRILITSATITRNMKHIFTALEYGALDYVHTPSLRFPPGSTVTSRQLRAAGSEMLNKAATILRLSDNKVEKINTLPTPLTKSNGVADPPPTPPNQSKPHLLAIGSSTGGPRTVAALLKELITPFPAPIIICQHIDEEFTQGFASWLSEQTAIPTSIARNGERPEAGRVYIAPGGYQNIEIARSGLLALSTPKRDHIYQPNISHLFESMAHNLGSGSCGVVLTGMGDDGASGMRHIKQAGGVGFAQNAQSAVIDAMPSAAREALGQPEGGSPAEIAAKLNQIFQKSSR